LLEQRYCISRAPQMQTTVMIHQYMEFSGVGRVKR